MRAWWKIVGWIAAAVVGVVLLVSLAARLLIDPNAHREQLQAALRDATGRDVVLQGPLSLSMFPWLAFEANDVAIANREGFGDAPFASLGQARLAVRLWPLITSRRVEFGPVTIDKLQLHLAVAANGRDNWSDVVEHLQRKETRTSTNGASAPAPAAKSPSLDLSVAALQLRASEVSFEDAQAGTRYVVSGLRVETGALRQGEPIDVRTELEVKRNGAPFGHFQLRTRLDLTTPGLVALADMQGRVSLAREGADDLPIDLKAPRLTLDVPTRNIEIDTIEGRIGETKATANLRVTQGSDGPALQGSVHVPTTNLRKLLQLLGAEDLKLRDTTALTRVGANAQVAYSHARGLQLQPLAVSIDGSKLDGALSIPDLGGNTLRFALQGDAIDADRYLPPRQAQAAAAPSSQTPSASNAPLEALRKLDLDGSLDLKQFTVAKVALHDLHVSLRARNGRLQFDPLRAGVFGGDAQTRLTVDVRDDVPTIHVEQSLDRVDVGAMLSQLIDLKQLQGRGRARFSLDMRGSDVPALLATASGPFDLTVENGALIGADLWYEIERAVASSQGKHAPSSVPNTGRTPFQRMHGQGTLANRTLHNERLEFVSDVATVHGRGDVDYGRDRLDLELTAKLLKAPPGRVLGMKLSRVEGVDIPLAVTGKLQEPKVQPDVTALLAAVAKGSLEEPLGGKVRKKLKKVLGF
jgi:AsmA protein